MRNSSRPVESTELVVSLDGDLDAACCDRVQRRLPDAVATGRSVVVDLAGLVFCDSNGLNVFLRARSAADKAGSPFMLRNLPPTLSRVLDLTGLNDHFFPAADSLDR